MAPAISNWLGERNPYNLPAPPDWWLRQLWERDAALRIFPGLTQPCYRIGRLSPRAKLLQPIALESETNRMMQAGCVPVVSLKPGATWNLDFFQWLDDHDGWRFRGPTVDAKLEKYVDALERSEAEVETQLDAAMASEAEARGTSAYFASLIRRRALAFVRGHQPESTKRSAVPDRTGPRT